MQVKGDCTGFSKDRTVFGEQLELRLVGAAINVLDADRQTVVDDGGGLAIQDQAHIILGRWFRTDIALKDDVACVVA